MRIKTTYRDLFVGSAALGRLNADKRKSNVVVAMADQFDILDPLFRKIERARRELRDEHALRDGDGHPVMQLVEGEERFRFENLIDFDSEMEALMDTEVAYDIKPIALDELGKKASITGSDLSVLRRIGVLNSSGNRTPADDGEDDED